MENGNIFQMIKRLCPDGVDNILFSDICSYIRGITYNKAQELNNGEKGIPVLRANNITLENNTLNFNDIKQVSNSVKINEKQWLRQGDILICAGSGSKEHIGKIAFIGDELKYTFGGFMGVIRTKTNNVLPRYIFHILTSPIFKTHLQKVSASNSSTINNINNETWKNFSIPVPPLAVQEEIVRILDNFAELTAELEKRKQQYEFYRDSLLNFDAPPPVA